MKLNKKKLMVLLATLAIASSNIYAASTSRILVKINSQSVSQNSNLESVYVGSSNRLMISTRIVAENMGFKVDWDQSTKKVTISNGTTTIVLGLNSKTVYVNGVKTTIDAPTEMKNSRIYVPVRFVSEVLGSTVDYNGKDKVITITTGTNAGGVVTPPTTQKPSNGLVNINQLKPGVDYTVDQVIANKNQDYTSGKTDIKYNLEMISDDYDMNTVKIKYGKFGDTVGGTKILDVGYLSSHKVALGIKYAGNPIKLKIMYFKGNTITKIEGVQSADVFSSYKIGDFGDYETSPSYYKEADKIGFTVLGSNEILIVDKQSTEFKVLP